MEQQAQQQQQEQEQLEQPPAYVQHEPDSFHLPSVPTHLPHHSHSHSHGRSHSQSHSHDRLPGIKSLHLPATTARHTPPNSAELSPPWGALPALTSASFPRVPDDVGSPMDTASVRSSLHEDGARRDTSVSMDDPDVRLAAEALSGLGNPGTFSFYPLHNPHAAPFHPFTPP